MKAAAALIICLSAGAAYAGDVFELGGLRAEDARAEGPACRVPAAGQALRVFLPRGGGKVSGLEQMTAKEWADFIREVREREFDDDHLDDADRQAVLDEWIRRNPEDRKKLTGHLAIDFVDLVLLPGHPGMVVLTPASPRSRPLPQAACPRKPAAS